MLLAPILAVGLLHTVLVIAVIGLIVWAITTWIPMPPMFKQIIYVVCAIFLILWLLRAVGVADIQI